MNRTKYLIQNNLTLLEHSSYLKKKIFSVEELAAYHESKILTSQIKLETDDGIICFTPLEWDSKMFGFPVGRIDYVLAGPTEINEEIKAKERLLKIIYEKYPDHYMFSRLDTRNISSIYAFENTGFNLVDGIETFYLDISNYSKYTSSDKTLIFRGASLQDEIEIGDIGKNIYIFDRFHNDNLLPKHIADEVQSEWLRNSVKGLAANYVAVAELNGAIISFATCKIDVLTELKIALGIIILVGTRKEYQGKGLGKEITKYALNWFKDQRVNIVQIKTQLANVPAAKTYIKSDFKLLNTELTFRKYKKN